MKQRIYIAGGAGMLGEAMFRCFSDDYELKVSDINITDPWISYLDFRDEEKYHNDVKSFNPDYLFHIGAHTDLEYCEQNIEDAYETNTKSVEYAIKISNELSIPLLFISTAGIFDGAKDVYDEDDQPNPMGHYARSKFLAEKLVQEQKKDHLICRAGWMMGGGPGRDKKFIGKIMSQIQSGKKELNIVNDKFGTPTYTHDFAATVKKLIEQKAWGLYNMACPGETDRVEIAEAIIHTLQLENEVTINTVASSFFRHEYFAPRPKSERLVNKRLDQSGLNCMRQWKICLREYLERDYPMKTNNTTGTETQELISIVIPSYNRAGFVLHAVQSALDQSWKNLEVVVIDDGSTDNTKEVLASFNTHPRFRYYYQENMGRSAARNKGFELTTGTWIMYLDSDDFLRSSAIQTLYDLATESKESGIVYGNFVFYNNEMGEYQHSCPFPEKRLDISLFTEVLNCRFWLTKTGSYLLKRQIAEKVGRFNTGFEPGEDLDYSIKTLLHTRASYSPETILRVHRHGNNTSEIEIQRAIVATCKYYESGKKHWINGFQPLEVKNALYTLRYRIANGYYETDRHRQALRYYFKLIISKPPVIFDKFIFRQLFASMLPPLVKQKWKAKKQAASKTNKA